MTANWLAWLRQWPVIDLLCWLCFMLLTASAWIENNPSSVEKDPQERSLGASTVLNQLIGTITASAIILGAIGAISAIGADKLSPAARVHFLMAGGATLFSLFSAVWALGSAPALVRSHNLAASRVVALKTAASLFFFLIAAVRLGFGLWHVLKPS